MIRFFVSHPTAANLLMLALLAAGLLAVPDLRRETFPDYAPTLVEVRVPYPGATSADVEDAVVRRIESAVESVEYVSELLADARDGVAVVTLEMAEGGDPASFLLDIKAEVEAVTDFPPQAEPATIRPIQRTDPVISVAVSGDMIDADLASYAEGLKDRMLGTPGISLVAIQGLGQRHLQIEVPRLTLLQLGISAEDLARVVSVQSLDLPAGSLESSEGDVALRFTDERRTAAEIEDLVVAGAETGGEVRLRDVATVREILDPPEEKILLGGRRALILAVEKTKQEDSLRVLDRVRAFVETERQRAPRGVRLVLTDDVTSVVEDRLQLLVTNGWQGLLLVLGVMWLFFGFRYSFWVAMGLPVAFLGALFVMPFLGMTINMLSMVALLMALGLMMDDAIVLAENIAREMAAGQPVTEATIAGVRGVAPGVLSSFLTTVAVFFPLAFLEGDIGKVLSPVPVVLLVVLAISLVEAFLILPHHLAHALAHARGRTPSRAQRAIERAMEWSRERIVGKGVDLAVSWRYVTAGLVIALFLASLGMVASKRVKFQAFPEIDGDVAMCRILMRPGTPLERTEAVAARVTQALAEVSAALTPRQPDGAPLVRNVVVRFNENRDAREQGPHVATVQVDFLSAESRVGTLDEVLARWREEVGPVPDALSLVFTPGGFGPAGRPIEVRLAGEDLDDLASSAARVETWFARFEGVESLMVDLRPGKPEAVLRLRAGATSLGLTASSVASQLRAAFHGVTAREVQVGREDYEVSVRVPASDRAGLAALDEFRVTLPTGQAVPLSAVVTRNMERGFARIARVDRRRTATVTGDVDTRHANTRELLDRFERELAPDLEAAGISVDLRGERAEGGRTQASMLRGLLIGLIGIFFILSYQFRSYLEPITVMLAIPLALIGVVWGHVALGLAISMPSMLGFASLAGVVVNDSILLVAFLKERRAAKASVLDAARGASRDRFRAVLLTSLTTIAGLIPLLTETSLQAQILIPLAASIVFGLTASTILVLFVIPAFYAIIADFGWAAPVAPVTKGEAGERIGLLPLPPSS